jgi:hypothetical protein
MKVGNMDFMPQGHVFENVMMPRRYRMVDIVLGGYEKDLHFSGELL